DIYVYTGKDGSFELYEDESTNYNYEKGKFSTIRFEYSEKDKTLNILPREGEFDGMIKNREFRVYKVSREQAVPFLSGKGFVGTILYNGEKTQIVL
ncbi:MAG: DUF5110 domain-containing protein, partial [Bacteroidales bacterium]|nr:DUF5110 domain-containing protein [Bacteroidales bacterium]